MHTNYTKSQAVESLSLLNERRREKAGEQGDRRHILGLLSSFTREEEEVRGGHKWAREV